MPISLQPDKRLRNSTSAEEPKLSTLLVHSEDEEEKDSGKNEAGSESGENESDASRDVDIVENSQLFLYRQRKVQCSVPTTAECNPSNQLV